MSNHQYRVWVSHTRGTSSSSRVDVSQSVIDILGTEKVICSLERPFIDSKIVLRIRAATSAEILSRVATTFSRKNRSKAIETTMSRRHGISLLGPEFFGKAECNVSLDRTDPMAGVVIRAEVPYPQDRPRPIAKKIACEKKSGAAAGAYVSDNDNFRPSRREAHEADYEPSSVPAPAIIAPTILSRIASISSLSDNDLDKACGVARRNNMRMAINANGTIIFMPLRDE